MTDWNAAPSRRDRTLAVGLGTLAGSLAFAALVLSTALPWYERAAYRRADLAQSALANAQRRQAEEQRRLESPPPYQQTTPAPASAACVPGSITPVADDTSNLDPPPVGESLPATVPATIRLTQGTIGIEMYGRRAACTVASMTYLARQGYFDDSPCHRVTTDGIYILQCGDPTGSGEGGPGYTLPEENTAGATYPAGTVALARTLTPHTGGSQFFIVYREAAAFPPGYTVFGRVVSGLDVVREIAANGVDGGGDDGRPAKPVTIESFTVG
jgi:peptidyl-prolyl cis-trans isomerase B (cyclophilin B)